MTYARVASGYQPGGPQSNLGFPDIPNGYGPEKTENYELGVKSTLFDRRLSLDADIYYIDWSNIQVTILSPIGTAFLANAGKAISKGLEFTAELKPTENLRIIATTAYTDAFRTTTNPPTPGKAGDRLPYTPKFSSSLSANQQFTISSAVRGFVGATVASIGNRFSDYTPGGLPHPEAHAYTYANLQAGLIRDGYTLTLFLKNVTDERGVLSAVAANDAGLSHYAVIIPRTIGLSLSKSF
jgi:outer membrane receptor protein involved in Fe transport